MVVVGDLEKAEGAPLSMGQALFEIAPLDAMVVEFAVPEEDIAHVREGMTVRFRLDAYPGRQWEGRIDRIHPRAEQREQQQVFVAQLAMENPAQLWKPGMSGRAKIVAPHRPLGWVLLHKAWERTAMKWGW
jgi:multidrug efflux pump subunit AcrA (membrane-fusion protein)